MITHRYRFVVEDRDNFLAAAPTIVAVMAPSYRTARAVLRYHLDQLWFDGIDGTALLRLHIRDAHDLGNVQAPASFLRFMERLCDWSTPGAFRVVVLPPSSAGLGSGRMTDGGR